MLVRHLASVAIGLAAASMLLFGCASGGLSKDDLAEQVRSRVSELVSGRPDGEEPADVECRGGLEARQGATQQCAVTFTTGEREERVVTVTAVDGSRITFDLA